MRLKWWCLFCLILLIQYTSCRWIMFESRSKMLYQIGLFLNIPIDSLKNAMTKERVSFVDPTEYFLWFM